MFKFMLLGLLTYLLVIVSAIPEDLPLRGGVKELSGDGLKDAEDTLKHSLSKLAAGDGPHFTISKIHSATRQTVSGSLYKYRVDLEDQDKNKKQCNISIWSQPWLENGIEVTFECEGDEKLVKKHSA